jgi:hypothetical protein
MISSENRFPPIGSQPEGMPRIKCGAGFFRIMLYRARSGTRVILAPSALSRSSMRS